MNERDRDEDAAWRSIIQHYGERPQLPDEPLDDPPVEGPTAEPVEPVRWPADDVDGALNTPATWDDEGHFIPPDPPPPPRPEGRRKWAWIGLFGSPTVMLVAVVLQLSLPGWVFTGLAGAFAGGFVYLVATMQRKGPDDWSHDDGAVV